jgi:acyl-CoA synthetase (NDP forming)
METLFSPRSLLVVGASDRPGNLAANIVRNLMDIGFPGQITLLGRRDGNLYGHRIHTSWEDLPPGIDLAVILVPALEVVSVIEQCGRYGIRWAVVESGGFGELSEEGRRIEAELKATATRLGVRFTGPNGLGVIDLRTRLALPFMHFPRLPPPGGVHLLVQSGGVGVYFIHRFAAENLGLGSFVSLGNKLDLDECDFLDYLRGRSPRGVCLYLEDIRNGRRFFEATRGYPCPLLVQKANVTRAGAQAASSHTAAIAVDDRVLDAALRQNRVIRVQEMKTMVTYAKAFTLPPMRGSRLLIVSRSGGHAVIAADLSERYGFSLPPLDPELEATARAALRARVVHLRNPLDLGDVFDLDVYSQILERGLSSPEVDGILFVHAYASGPETIPSRKVVADAARISAALGKPIFACLLCSDEELATLRRQQPFPIFDSPEETMAAAAMSRDHGHISLQTAAPPRTAPLPPFPRGERVRAILEGAAEGWLPARLALELLAAAGLPVAPFRVAREHEDVAAAAREVGFPLVMKLLVPALPHKSDQGGVVLGVNTLEQAEEVDGRLRELAARLAPGEPLEGVLLQRMEYGFREVFVGGRRDPSFGPIVLVGLGGVLVEVFRDVAIRLAPLTEQDLDDLLEEPLSFKALKGARGVPPADLQFLRDTIQRVSRLLLDYPRLCEIDVNPIKVHRAGRGGVAVDARIRVGE